MLDLAKLETAVNECIFVPNDASFRDGESVLPERFQDHRIGGNSLARICEILDQEETKAKQQTAKQIRKQETQRRAEIYRDQVVGREANAYLDSYLPADDDAQYRAELAFAKMLASIGALSPEDFVE